MQDHKEACLTAVDASGSIATLEHIAKYNGEIEHRYLRNTAIFSPNFLHGFIKSRRMRCTGHVARMGEERGV